MEHEAEIAFEAWLKTFDGLRTAVIGNAPDLHEALRLAYTAGYERGYEDSANVPRGS